MKFHGLPCMQCFDLIGKPPDSDNPVTQLQYYDAEIRDDLTIDVVCENGHKNVFCLTIYRFEILFDLGAMALLDGYTREAVSSFAAAIERFHEYAIKVLLKATDTPNDVFDKLWKQVSNQSERQLGAFLFLYGSSLKEIPPKTEDRVPFRNKVIHKGYIPPLAESLDYASFAYGYVQTVFGKLHERFPEQVNYVRKHEMIETFETAKERGEPSGISVPTVLDIGKTFGVSASFDDHLKRLRTARWLKS